ncbi:MAG: cell wall anchor protein, partial [Muribaculaceae bacterium]|nr:cell wall anchor protein [Muribaculaceae bacterium]
MIKINSILRTVIASFIFATLGLCNNNINAQPNVTFNASIDSLVILMGKQTVLHYQIIQDKGTDGIVVIDDPHILAPHVEIAKIKDNDTTDLGNDREEIHKSLIIQAFDSGIWEIPAAKYVIGKDTIFSNELALKVIPVDVDSLATIHGFKEVQGVPFNPFDFIPDFIYYYWNYILLVILLIIAACCYYISRRKGEEVMAQAEVPLLPPYEEAIDALGTLKAAKLWQAGQDKEYYTRLTDILRRYIDRRFGINAVEMTTTQIIDTLKRNEETR